MQDDSPLPPEESPDSGDFLLLEPPERGREHPGLPSPLAFVLAFCGIALAGGLGGLVGFGIVNVDTRGTGGTLLGAGALLGAVIAALGAAVVAVVSLRARSQWFRRPIQTRVTLERPHLPGSP